MRYDIGICSMFRDSETWGGTHINQVGNFFNQMVRHQARTGFEFAYFLVEGNSADNTWETLKAYEKALPSVHLFKHEVSGSAVASVVSDARFKNLSAVGNTALRAARDGRCRDVFWVESDFLLPHYLLTTLLQVRENDWWKDCLGVCPIPQFHTGNRDQFYDTWAFEGANGERWGNGDLAKLKDYPSRYRPMNSFGSCALLNGDNLRKHNLDFREGCFPALCAAGREAGLSLWCDKHCIIEHPASRNINGRLV